MGKTGKTNKKYSPEFKLNVILDMREHGWSYHETVRRYWGNDVVEENYTSRVAQWERIYLEEGAEGFMKKSRGKSPNAGGPKKPLNKSIEEDLIAENQWLRMENEYLKKLSALVLAEERKNGKKPK